MSRKRIHGASRSNSPIYDEYQVWKAMKRRCFYKGDKHFKDYGGRGVTVCDRWMSFENFISDMGPRPDGDMSLDRIDNSGNYEPCNCRWATRSEQSSNKRNVAKVLHEGKLIPAFALAKMNGIKRSTFSMRISRQGLSPLEAATHRGKK